tara:strand:+ start:2216 stop:2386 length:171 start_codon:yes stop_codon:yes gene_type:complete
MAIKEQIIQRCKILEFLGDAAVGSDYLHLDDKKLLSSYGWVLEISWDDSLNSIKID